MSVYRKQVDIWRCDYTSCKTEKEVDMGKKPGWCTLGDVGFSDPYSKPLSFCALKCLLKHIGKTPYGLRVMKEVYEEA